MGKKREVNVDFWLKGADGQVTEEMLKLHSVLEKGNLLKRKPDSEEVKAMQQARALFNIK